MLFGILNPVWHHRVEVDHAALQHEDVNVTQRGCYINNKYNQMKVNLHTGSSIFILRCMRMEPGTVFSINWSIVCGGGSILINKSAQNMAVNTK